MSLAKNIRVEVKEYYYWRLEGANLHYKCEVAKLGIAATGKFLSGKREREPLCNIAKLNRISGLPKNS
jgi:hypothetical protein